jgi:hypothetical protein
MELFRIADRLYENTALLHVAGEEILKIIRKK